MSLKSLENLTLDNRLADLGDEFGRITSPQPFNDWRLAAINQSACELIGLDVKQTNNEQLTQWLTGQQQWPGSKPFAQIYAGHQFGVWVPQLGDGRALLLGEVADHRTPNLYWDIQIKGGGLTPFSRMADGRAVLRSTIREYLCSEAMHGLGIATTRALAMFHSNEPVYRERTESAALLVRVAQSHLRFGSLELHYHKQHHEFLKILVDFLIDTQYPHCRDSGNPYAQLFTEIINRTASLIAQWQSVGFCHGVMNTDNMSLLGLTIDYGPFGFLEAFDPDYICNHSDHQGRYSFENQVSVGLWNCYALGNCFLNLVDEAQLREILEQYSNTYYTDYLAIMRKKLGLITSVENTDKDHQLINDLLAMLQKNQTDYSIFFRRLSSTSANEIVEFSQDQSLFNDQESSIQWLSEYHQRIVHQIDSQQTTDATQSADTIDRDTHRMTKMKAINPKYILRNYMAETAIRKARDENDFSETDKLIHLLHHPFDEHPEHESYAGFSPQWAQQLSISCSS